MLRADWVFSLELGLFPGPILRRVERRHTGLVYRAGDDYVEPAVWVDFVTGANQHNRDCVELDPCAWEHVQCYR